MSGGWGTPGQQPRMIVETPDWAAMAEAADREARRRRMLRVGVGAAAAVTLAGIVAVAVAVQGSGAGKPSAGPLPTAAGPASAGSSAAPSSAAPGADGLHLGPTAQVGPADGRSGPALTLHGTSDDYAETGANGVDTSRSFTVSAVVRNDAPAQPKAAVSQGGDAFFAFYLGREDNAAEKNVNQWVFKVQTAAAAGKTVMALSGTPAAAGRWTALTGVYDAKAGTISLYVDGVLARSAPVPGISPAPGPVEIGRARYRSHWADAWNGGITDVQAWDQALTGSQIAQVVRTGSAGVAARGSWLKP